MDWKLFLLRLAGLVIFAALGLALYAITFNILVIAGAMPSAEGSEGIGKVMTEKAMLIYMASIPAGLISLFMKEDWRWILYLCPLYAPSLYAVTYTIIH